ncbi:bifunctional ATP-dependent dihydroxyacetone kinase/FAD-AMP lyase (cyclizing)-like protein, partial [Leptotrombidium deliense]
MEMSRKYLINELESSVRENLIGLVLRNESLQLFEDENVVFDKNCLQKSNKVVIIGGGGSGHEPLHAGYVGEGFLTAAVAGNIFAAPSSNSIFKAIKRLSAINNNEVLLLVGNYTGDRLTFGLAKERALLENIKVEMLLFGEDCAFIEMESSVGRRGLAGQAVMIKLAGALNDGKRTALQIKTELESISKGIHTISVSLTACNIPGVGMSFTLPTDQMEVGLGIHGEAGIRRTSVRNASHVVELMWSYIEKDLVKKNGSLAIFINNLGGLTVFEMNIICKEIVLYARSKGFQVERIYCDTFVTSLNMAGVSITVLEVGEHLINLLDASGVCDKWQSKCDIRRVPNKDPFFVTSESVRNEESENEKLDKALELPFGKDFFIVAVREACKQLILNERYLNELDSAAGDSDCGSTLSKGCNAILKALNENKLRPSFTQLARISENTMGGTSGAVYSLLFSAAAAQLTSDSKNVNKVEFWLNCITKAMNKISEYGQAKVGDRTLLDSLNAIRLVFEENKNSTDYVHVAQQLANNVDAAAKSTASMKPKAGRASYVDTKLVTQVDPGAVAVSIWITA